MVSQSFCVGNEAEKSLSSAMKQLGLFIGFLLAGLANPILAQEREMIIQVPQSAYSQGVKMKGWYVARSQSVIQVQPVAVIP